MQSHQRYFPLGGNRFAFVANGGDPEVVRAGQRARARRRGSSDAESSRASATSPSGSTASPRARRDHLRRRRGLYADKTERLVGLVARARRRRGRRAGGAAREGRPGRRARAGVPRARGPHRLRVRPPRRLPDEADRRAVDEQYLPEPRGGPLPASRGRRVLAAADKIDDLRRRVRPRQPPDRLARPVRAAPRRDRPVPPRARGPPDPAPRCCRKTSAASSRNAWRGSSDAAGGVRPRGARLSCGRPRRRRVADGASRGQADAGVRRCSYGIRARTPPRRTRSRLCGAPRSTSRCSPSLPNATSRRRSRPRDRARRRPGPAAALAPHVNRFFDEVLVMAEDERVRANRLGSSSTCATPSGGSATSASSRGSGQEAASPPGPEGPGGDRSEGAELLEA